MLELQNYIEVSSVDTSHPNNIEKKILLFLSQKNLDFNNDFRPVALTSIVIRSFEHIIAVNLWSQVQHLLHPYPFVYNYGRGTGDAQSTTTHFILKHLENPTAYARLQSMDFSSAFNTILFQILLKNLKQMQVSSYGIRWYYAFLIERQQKVKDNSNLSDMQVLELFKAA